MNAYLFTTEHFSPNSGQQFFGRRSRGDKSSFNRFSYFFNCRQRLIVDLSIDGKWQPLQVHEEIRNGFLYDRLEHECSQLTGVYFLARDVVSHYRVITFQISGYDDDAVS